MSDDEIEEDEVNNDLSPMALRREKFRSGLVDEEATVRISAIPGIIRLMHEIKPEFERLAAEKSRNAGSLEGEESSRHNSAKEAARYRKYVAKINGILK